MKAARELFEAICILSATFFLAIVLITVVPFLELWDWILPRYIAKCDRCGKRGKIRYIALCHVDNIPDGKTVDNATMKLCPKCRL